VLLDGIQGSDGNKLVELRREAILGFMKGRQETVVCSGLVSAKARLLIDDEFCDERRLRNAGVGLLDELDGFDGVVNLKVKCCCGKQQRNHGQQKRLAQNSIELG
jgi:hypothetical protein